jgi:hypothetical protein
MTIVTVVSFIVMATAGVTVIVIVIVTGTADTSVSVTVAAAAPAAMTAATSLAVAKAPRCGWVGFLGLALPWQQSAATCRKRCKLFYAVR